jgi:hypothetical protein
VFRSERNQPQQLEDTSRRISSRRMASHIPERTSDALIRTLLNGRFTIWQCWLMFEAMKGMRLRPASRIHIRRQSNDNNDAQFFHQAFRDMWTGSTGVRSIG